MPMSVEMFVIFDFPTGAKRRAWWPRDAAGTHPQALEEATPWNQSELGHIPPLLSSPDLSAYKSLCRPALTRCNELVFGLHAA